ncbi:protein kinase [Fictibacillus nanhaiensis]|uniref:serine/threonine protein kinase n=1 Tax=Fictibacillus nanhaiensis TaxID=742169 RepID=UPI002E2404FB|nr:protein kinase [Fictibacillus nanhaiensis]MED1862315.1 protein kinase [Fictibacillus nanhaiensis]
MITEFWKCLQRALFDRPLKAGQHVHEQRYQIQKVLGMGSYGITYLALDTLTEEIIVLKQLRNTKAKTTAGLLSFQREAQILETLHHHPVPKLLNAFQNNQGHFIAMEWIKGETFEDLIFRDNQTYNEKQTIDILLELLSITERFHKNGIIHRDLRIPNIIQRDNKLIVIDFGLACHLSDKETEDSHDHPEKLRMRAVKVESDLFALGHFALFLLYSSYTPQSQKELSWEEELDISHTFRSVLRKMLQLDEPFHSVTDVKKSLYCM